MKRHIGAQKCSLFLSIFSRGSYSLSLCVCVRRCMDKSMTSTDVRDVIDWDYYITRLSTTILKIVVIPGMGTRRKKMTSL